MALDKSKVEQPKPDRSNLVAVLLLAIIIGLFLLLAGEGNNNNRHNKNTPLKADVYIQAGHEGRLFGKTGSVSPYGREIDWTGIVADEATRILRQAGVSVIRASADQRRKSVIRLALSIHFDGSKNACSTGASIGLNNNSDRRAARVWKRMYRAVFPFKWMPNNFSKNLKYYYNYRYTVASDAELVLELGEISCPEQARWMKPRLRQLGALVAYFAAQRVGASGVSRPEF
jgi:N-acetylmuramoyl-L-alanine amidase